MPAKAKFQFSDVDYKAVNTIRVLAAEMVQKANSGHPGMPMGFAMVGHVLWTRFLQFNPDQPFWAGRDRFILSGGHGSAFLYSMLHLSGYNLSMDDLKNFRQWESRTPGHPEFGMTPGVETTTGPLGQGFSNAIGMAMAQRYIKGRFALRGTSDFDPLNHHIFVELGDGDLQEGVASETASIAGHLKLDNLVALYDDNRISIDGGTDVSWSEDVARRLEAYGWRTIKADGTDPEAIFDAIQNALDSDGRPTMILFRTHIGFGSPNKQDSEKSHGAPLGEEEIELTKKQLGWDYPPFTVPEEVYELYTEVADRGREANRDWEEKFAQWLTDTGNQTMWAQLIEGDMPEGWADGMPEFEAGTPVATRGASGKALNFFANKLHAIFGGCADLAGSVKTYINGEPDFLPGNPSGRNIYYGIREHGMGSIANGIALYGTLRPYTGTFLIFSDYMRPPIRLAAMMGLPVIYAFSHDSIGVGEDGPTHQPIEQYATLRAVPNLWVFRPGDANEMVQAWKIALERLDGPCAILSTRQGLPVYNRTVFTPASEVAKGGYILADAEDGDPELILIATGSEVGLAMATREKLVEEGRKVRVVSLPCWELFDEQDEEYRQKVLPPTVTKRVVIECGISMGWENYAGDKGLILSKETFGASAPGKVLFEKFGFSVEAVLEAIKMM